MGTRLELHQEFIEILGSSHVYYQPPESIKLVFPCIIYELNTITTFHADDNNYHDRKLYQVTIVDKNPDSTIYTDVLDHFRMCRYIRTFTSDNLNHFILELYY